MSRSIKLINPNEYLLELDISYSLYLNQFFDESDFVKNTKTANKTIDMAGITDEDEDDDEIDGVWGSVESSEKSESSEDSESLDFAAMNDAELIDYYNSRHNDDEAIKYDGHALYDINNYIFDYYTKDSLLVVYGKLFYRLSPYGNDNINTNMKDLIIDFELKFDTTNAKFGQINILNSIIKANVNNCISCNQPLSSVVDDIVFIPFRFGKILPKNVKLISLSKKEAFNFNNLQYTNYELKQKPELEPEPEPKSFNFRF